MSEFQKLYKTLFENVDDKLKEDVYRIFHSNGFKENITYTTEQRSLPATKYVIDQFMNKYDMVPCEGRYKEYRYYFPIIDLEDEFVVDLGNNIDKKIEPIVVPLNGSDYQVTKKFKVDEFLQKYGKLRKEYNL